MSIRTHTHTHTPTSLLNKWVTINCTAGLHPPQNKQIKSPTNTHSEMLQPEPFSAGLLMNSYFLHGSPNVNIFPVFKSSIVYYKVQSAGHDHPPRLCLLFSLSAVGTGVVHLCVSGVVALPLGDCLLLVWGGVAGRPDSTCPRLPNCPLHSVTHTLSPVNLSTKLKSQ